MDHYEPLQTKNGLYKRITFIRQTYEHALSELSQDNFLKSFFESMAIPIETDWTTEQVSDLESSLTIFADYFVDNFFLPLKCSTRKTPQPSLSISQGTEQLTATTQRLSALRQDCLIRDRHRCVISRKFDRRELRNRQEREGRNEAKDDDGHFFKNQTKGMIAQLRVAHILPHSLMSVSSEKTDLNDSKKTALKILNMFDNGVVPLIEGSNIDRPHNALTLTPDFHELFGNFELFFEPTGQLSHTYQINSTEADYARDPILPLVRTLYLTSTRTIDLPSPRFLALHRAITRILHLSAAGEYIDKIFRDLEVFEIKADGSTDLGRLVERKLKAGG